MLTTQSSHTLSALMWLQFRLFCLTVPSRQNHVVAGCLNVADEAFSTCILSSVEMAYRTIQISNSWRYWSPGHDFCSLCDCHQAANDRGIPIVLCQRLVTAMAQDVCVHRSRIYAMPHYLFNPRHSRNNKFLRQPENRKIKRFSLCVMYDKLPWHVYSFKPEFW